MSIGNFDTGNISTHTTIALWVFAGVTVGLGIYSAICPPQGVIDKSIFEFGALMAGFATLAVTREAIREGLGVKYKHGETEVEINKKNDEDVQELHPCGTDREFGGEQ